MSNSHLARVCCVPAIGDLGTALVGSTGPLYGWCPGNGCVVPGPSLKLLLAQTLLPSIRSLSCMAPASLCAVPTCCLATMPAPRPHARPETEPFPTIKNDLQCLELLWTAALTSPQYTSVLGPESASWENGSVNSFPLSTTPITNSNVVPCQAPGGRERGWLWLWVELGYVPYTL